MGLAISLLTEGGPLYFALIAGDPERGEQGQEN